MPKNNELIYKNEAVMAALKRRGVMREGNPAMGQATPDAAPPVNSMESRIEQSQVDTGGAQVEQMGDTAADAAVRALASFVESNVNKKNVRS